MMMIWSVADECAHYAELGCHIANIARCERNKQIPKNNSSPSYKSKNNTKDSKRKQKKSTHDNNDGRNNNNNVIIPSNDDDDDDASSSSHDTRSEYNEMYDQAMSRHPWLSGIERFDPNEYHPEDVIHIPEVAMNDGDDDDDDDEEGGSTTMTLTLTNVTDDTTNICFVTVYDVDVCDGEGNVLKSGVASTTVRTTLPSAAGIDSSTGTKTTTTKTTATTATTTQAVTWSSPLPT